MFSSQRLHGWSSPSPLLVLRFGWVVAGPEINFKPSSHIVFGGIWLYSTVLQYPRATIWKHSDQILNTVKYPQCRSQILGIANITRFYSQYREYPRQPLDTFGNPEYSNYLLFKRFLRRTRSSNKRWRPQSICLRASIVFIRTNTVKIQIYWQLLLAIQILGIWWYLDCQHQVPPNTIWTSLYY